MKTQLSVLALGLFATVGAFGAASSDGGYTFAFSGDYSSVQTIEPTGRVCRVVLDKANLAGGLTVPEGIKVVLAPAAGTRSKASSIAGEGTTLVLEGEGELLLEGPGTVASVSNLVVKSSVLKIRSTGASGLESAVVSLAGCYRQKGGSVDLDLTAGGDRTLFGISLTGKNPKGDDGKREKLVYGEIAGGQFTASVAGVKSAALKGAKGSVDFSIKGEETRVTVSLSGEGARFIDVAGDIKLKGGRCTVGCLKTGGEAAEARVFKAGKDIRISGGAYSVRVPAKGAEIFSSDGAILIEGGEFDLESDNDCFSALDDITVNGGLVHAVSLDDDVFDSNGGMTINGGTILAFTTAKGHEAFDVDPNKTKSGRGAHRLTVNGGTVFGTGGKKSAWPVDLVRGPGVRLEAGAELPANEYSGRFLTLSGTADGRSVKTTVRLPLFKGDTCAVLATCPGYNGTMKCSDSAPEGGSRNFHDLYVEEQPIN